MQSDGFGQRDKGVNCEICEAWYRTKCQGISDTNTCRKGKEYIVTVRDVIRE